MNLRHATLGSRAERAGAEGAARHGTGAGMACVPYRAEWRRMRQGGDCRIRMKMDRH